MSVCLGWAAIVLPLNGWEKEEDRRERSRAQRGGGSGFKNVNEGRGIRPCQLIRTTTRMTLHLDRAFNLLLSRLLWSSPSHQERAFAFRWWSGVGMGVGVPHQPAFLFPALGLLFLLLAAFSLAITLAARCIDWPHHPRPQQRAWRRHFAAIVIGQGELWSLSSPPASFSPLPWHAWFAGFVVSGAGQKEAISSLSGLLSSCVLRLAASLMACCGVEGKHVVLPTHQCSVQTACCLRRDGVTLSHSTASCFNDCENPLDRAFRPSSRSVRRKRRIEPGCHFSSSCLPAVD